MNEHQVAFGEGTCGCHFGAKPVSKGGKALMSIDTLSQIGLERAKTAREAVQIMGDLAVQYGFYGEGFEGSGESLMVIDPSNAWVFHVSPDPSGASAIWAAQRVPDGHATCCANMFTIRSMDLEDPENFLYSASALEVATRLELWAPGTPFDFARKRSPTPALPYSTAPAAMSSGRAHLLTRSRNLAHAYHQASTPTASLRSTLVVESGARFRCSHHP